MANNASQSFYSRFSKLYSILSSFLFQKNYQFVVKKVLALQPKTLLDVGCGSGEFLELLYKNNPAIALSAQDIAEPMIQKVQQKYQILLQRLVL